MTRNEVQNLQLANHEGVKACCDATGAEKGSLGRIVNSAEFARLHCRSMALNAISYGHADEVRRALRECGVYEAGEVENA